VNESIRISEIFGPTIQGEGALIGQPTVFVRTGGCDYRCSWCDTRHAVDSDFRHEWAPMTAEDIMARVRALSKGQPLMVSLSGGNPALQSLAKLIALGRAEGYRFALETQGSVAKDWFADLDVLTLSPKPPSSGMTTDWDALNSCVQAAHNGPRIALKFVVFDEADYTYAKSAASRYPHVPVYLQPGNPMPPSPEDNAKTAVNREASMARLRWLVDKTLADQWFTATVLPQLHVLLWGNKRGV
jgi:7-carboxy-7-deazaguanine synthase